MKHDMSGTRPLAEAVHLLRAELQAVAGRTAPLAATTAAQAWLAYTRFARQRFAVPQAPDADGLLFQYGTYATDGPPAFTLDLTRQFEVADDDGEHDHYVHVHCELRYDPVPELRALEHFDTWFFHDSGDNVDRWAAEVRGRAVWEAVRDRAPTGGAVHQEQV
ncbi:hypothetical protein [Streptomyces monomycini]|uniref:hypothetical protein n=1 Tax=Streptomyces monomycini TaxID=371720 RepID=UPI000996ACA1|nr:hypothetical protein [Streptomyces monomycini]